MNDKTLDPIHKAVQDYYGSLAKNEGSCCGPQSATGAPLNVIYPPEMLTDLPTDIANFTAGSGDPVSTAGLKAGEVVLDLGSGGGLDCFLAARLVGASGRVIGVDMTPAMLERARANALRLNLPNVEFRQGFLEDLPVEAGSVDVILSNCVINLSPEKPRVFKEMFRVLKPGGRIAVSDIVTNRPLTEAARHEQQDWCGCISGALPIREYQRELELAGFEDIRIEPDLDAIEKAVASGQAIRHGDGTLTKDEILTRLQTWESDERNMFVPHRITARKPA
jgi:SAM-dependent methyltransferase